MTPDEVKELIVRAFANSEHPGDWCLVDSPLDEPASVAEEFMGKTDWRTLEPSFIDQAPGGLGSALSFFSDEAFRFYLPAFLIADIDGKLQQADPVFSLTHGLTDDRRGELINPRRYGNRTWFDLLRCKFATFTDGEVSAIVAYLRLMRERSDFDKPQIDQALASYWADRSKPAC